MHDAKQTLIYFMQIPDLVIATKKCKFRLGAETVSLSAIVYQKKKRPKFSGSNVIHMYRPITVCTLSVLQCVHHPIAGM